jgi:hypothetical protein
MYLRGLARLPVDLQQVRSKLWELYLEFALELNGPVKKIVNMCLHNANEPQLTENACVAWLMSNPDDKAGIKYAQTHYPTSSRLWHLICTQDKKMLVTAVEAMPLRDDSLDLYLQYMTQQKDEDQFALLKRVFLDRRVSWSPKLVDELVVSFLRTKEPSGRLACVVSEIEARGTPAVVSDKVFSWLGTEDGGAGEGAFVEGLKRHESCARLWAEYIRYLRGRGEDARAREVVMRAVKSVPGMEELLRVEE